MRIWNPTTDTYDEYGGNTTLSALLALEAALIKSIIRIQNDAAGNDYSKSTTAWASIDATNLKHTLTSSEVAVGDWVGVSFSCAWNNGSAGKYADVTSWVSGAPARYWSSGTSTPAGEGIQAWGSLTTAYGFSGSTVWRQIEAADLSSGALEIRLMRAQSNTNATVIYCRTDNPVHFQIHRVRL